MVSSFLLFFFLFFSAPSWLLFWILSEIAACWGNRHWKIGFLNPRKLAARLKGQVKLFLSSGRDLYYQYLFYQEVLCSLAWCIYNSCSAIAQRCCVFPTWWLTVILVMEQRHHLLGCHLFSQLSNSAQSFSIVSQTCCKNAKIFKEVFIC